MADAKTSAKVVDFTNVKDSGARFNKKRVAEGEYLAKVVKVEDSKTKSTEEFQWLFTIQLVDHPTARYPYYCKLVDNQLWKIRNLLVAAGISVPKKRVKLNPSVVVGKTIGVVMEDDEYDGKLQSVIASTIPTSEVTGSAAEADDEDVADDEVEDDEEVADDEVADDEEVEDDEPTPAPKKKAAKKAEVTEDELDELDIEDI